MKPFRVSAVLGQMSPFLRTVSLRVRNVFLRIKGTTFLIVGLLVISFIFFSLWLGTKKQLDNPQDIVNRQSRTVVENVGKLMILPGEVPTVATITDASRLKDQAFFAHAKNGDRVLFYRQEQLVILYDPTVNKIVNVGSVTKESSPSAQTAGSPVAPKFTQPGMQ